MGIIKFKEANCKSCYKCIRACDLKAISFSNEQAQIIEEQCILCGKCTLACPQNAKQVMSDLPLIRGFLDSKDKLYATLSPAYIAAFPGAQFSLLSAALKKLGFAGVFDTAVGATLVLDEYAALLAKGDMENIIASACPACTLLVERYYPDLVQYLSPVLSPACAHARVLRAQFGQDIKVVSIGSCIAQKKSAGKGDLDAVLTFDELQDWLRSEHITLDERDEHCAPRGSARGMAFYLPGGITGGLVTQMGRYKTVSSDGLSRCIGALKSIQHDGISGYFAELYSCGGACVKGPGIRRQDTVPYLFAKDMLLNASVDDQASTEKYDISTTYAPDIVEIKAPTDSEINAILSKMVAATGGGLLNCGSCGYPTCRQKAIAIYQGKADMDMCLPYMRQRAESMSNVILEYTPNAVFLVDEDYKILQHNPAADRLFSRHGKSMVGEPINNYLHLSGFEKLKTGGKPIIEELSTTVTCNLTVSQSILAVPHGDILVILKDVTAEQENLAAIQKLRVETLNVTQTIIDKQMRSAQEIASLLGETTGETKAALIKLKKALKEGTTL